MVLFVRRRDFEEILDLRVGVGLDEPEVFGELAVGDFTGRVQIFKLAVQLDRRVTLNTKPFGPSTQGVNVAGFLLGPILDVLQPLVSGQFLVALFFVLLPRQDGARVVHCFVAGVVGVLLDGIRGVA